MRLPLTIPPAVVSQSDLPPDDAKRFAAAQILIDQPELCLQPDMRAHEPTVVAQGKPRGGISLDFCVRGYYQHSR